MDANIEPFRIQSFNQSIVPWRVPVVKGGHGETPATHPCPRRWGADRTSLLIRKSVFSLITMESVILKGGLKNIIPENAGSHDPT